MPGDLELWWNGLPKVTRVLFAGSLGLTLAANFGFVGADQLLLNFNYIYRNFHVWRLVTPFFFHGRLGFPFLMNLMFLLQYGASIETETFSSNTADYLFFILVVGSCLLIPGFLVPLPILGNGLILAIIYYWSRKNPNRPMAFYGMIQFKSMYFPWVLIGFRLLTGGSPIVEILGALCGHFYHFLRDIFPAQYRYEILQTPQFLKDWFPSHPAPGAYAPRAVGGGGYNWGPGHRL